MINRLIINCYIHLRHKKPKLCIGTYDVPSSSVCKTAASMCVKRFTNLHYFSVNFDNNTKCVYLMTYYSDI